MEDVFSNYVIESKVSENDREDISKMVFDSMDESELDKRDTIIIQTLYEYLYDLVYDVYDMKNPFIIRMLNFDKLAGFALLEDKYNNSYFQVFNKNKEEINIYDVEDCQTDVYYIAKIE
jgi:hypothetical protein